MDDDVRGLPTSFYTVAATHYGDLIFDMHEHLGARNDTRTRAVSRLAESIILDLQNAVAEQPGLAPHLVQRLSALAQTMLLLTLVLAAEPG